MCHRVMLSTLGIVLELAPSSCVKIRDGEPHLTSEVIADTEDWNWADPLCNTRQLLSHNTGGRPGCGDGSVAGRREEWEGCRDGSSWAATCNPQALAPLGMAGGTHRVVLPHLRLASCSLCPVSCVLRLSLGAGVRAVLAQPSPALAFSSFPTSCFPPARRSKLHSLSFPVAKPPTACIPTSPSSARPPDSFAPMLKLLITSSILSS